MTMYELPRRKEIPRSFATANNFRRRGTDRWSWSMTRGQQVGIVLVVGLMVMSAIAASTQVQPQPSAHGREAPSIFDGILGNVAGSPEMSTAELRAALTESSAIGWRALGGVMQVEKPALLRLLAQDATSVLIDGRAEVGPKPRLRNAVSIPLPEASKAKDDGRLPMTDHNTRIFVVGTDGTEARAVAEAIVHDAFHNVTFFGGAITDLPELLDDEEG